MGEWTIKICPENPEAQLSPDTGDSYPPVHDPFPRRSIMRLSPDAYMIVYMYKRLE